MGCGRASICAHRRMRNRFKDCKRRQAELATADSQLWSGARRVYARAAQHVAHKCSSDMGFAPIVTRLLRLPLDESTPCESELFVVGEGALNCGVGRDHRKAITSSGDSSRKGKPSFKGR